MKSAAIAFIATTALIGSFALSSFAAVSSDTQDFIEKATIGNMFEIKSSQLALKRTDNADVRDFANQMIKDHTQVGDRMKKALSAENKKLVPKTLDEDHQDKLNDLQKASAEDFDKEYIDAQVDAHEDAVDLFQKYADSGDDARLKTFAARNLPILQQHKQHIKGIQDKVETVGSR